MPAPKLCSPQKALEALKNGEAIPGNLAEMRNQASLTEFEDTWQSFGCPDCDGHGRGDASKPTLHHVSDTSRLHTIFHAHLCHTPSFTHIFVTHHLSYTTLSHTIVHTYLCHTPSFTHTSLLHTIFHTHLGCTPSLPHTFFHTHTHNSSTCKIVTHHLSHTSLLHTIFYTHLGCTPSLPHTFFHTHTIFPHAKLSHTIFHTQPLHIQPLHSSIIHHLPCLSRPATVFQAGILMICIWCFGFLGGLPFVSLIWVCCCAD